MRSAESASIGVLVGIIAIAAFAPVPLAAQSRLAWEALAALAEDCPAKMLFIY